jgi:hypothetical protein
MAKSRWLPPSSRCGKSTTGLAMTGRALRLSIWMFGRFRPEWSRCCYWRLRFLRNFWPIDQRKHSHNYCMEPARKVLQIVRIFMLVSIVCFAFIGERVGQSTAPDRNVYFAITLVAITTVGIIFAVRRLFVLRSEATLVSEPENAAALNRWRTGHLVIYALSESVALFGLVLRILGFNLSEVMPFYLAGFALMLLFGPRRPTA